MVIGELECSGIDSVAGRLGPVAGHGGPAPIHLGSVTHMRGCAPKRYCPKKCVNFVPIARERLMADSVVVSWLHVLDRTTVMSSGAPATSKLLPEAPESYQRMSARNLKYMRAFAKAWRDPEIVQGRLAQSPVDRKVPQAVAQIPWGHYADFRIMPICVPVSALGAVIVV
jgi:hypothetical protein